MENACCQCAVLALAWLQRHAPSRSPVCLVHADCRTGNYLIEAGELTAVLDWEFAGFSDPLEDLGWMLARYWRFGAYELEAGGIGLVDGHAHAVLVVFAQVCDGTGERTGVTDLHPLVLLTASCDGHRRRHRQRNRHTLQVHALFPRHVVSLAASGYEQSRRIFLPRRRNVK